jgi:hypothetical protein
VDEADWSFQTANDVVVADVCDLGLWAKVPARWLADAT